MKKNLSWFNPKLISKKLSNIGEGVFTAKDIKKGELLTIFGGYVIPLSEEKELPDDYRDSGIQISDEFVLSSLNSKELTDLYNHSCNPNSGIKGQIFLVAMRNIKKSEQITFDYAMCLFDNKKVGFSYNVKCLCGSKNCRGDITGNDWKKKELQKKYNGYFQYYLQEKINKKK
jgi:SET domain-containing protein